MPICDACRDASEGIGSVPVCPACGAGPIGSYADGGVRFHKVRPPKSVTKVRCEGTGQPPVIRSGHDHCNGCPCQHKPRGSWNASNE